MEAWFLPNPVTQGLILSFILGLSTAHFVEHHTSCHSEVKSQPYSVQPSVIFFSDFCVYISKVLVFVFVQLCCFVLVVLMVSLFL